MVILALVINLPSFPLQMIAEAAPFTPHAPGATMTRTSFEVREFSVSFKSVYRGSHSAPSAGVEKRRTPPIDRPLPHAGVRTTSSPNYPLIYAIRAPNVTPTGALLVLTAKTFDGSFISVSSGTPIGITFIYMP